MRAYEQAGILEAGQPWAILKKRRAQQAEVVA